MLAYPGPTMNPSEVTPFFNQFGMFYVFQTTTVYNYYNNMTYNTVIYVLIFTRRGTVSLADDSELDSDFSLVLIFSQYWPRTYRGHAKDLLSHPVEH